MVFVSRPGHAVSLFWVFFSRCQRSSMSTISTSLAKPPLSYQNLIIVLVHSNGFFDDERRNLKRNVWHQRWAKGGLKMVFVSRPGHAVSPFWDFFFKVPEVFHVHNFHKSAKTTIIVPKPDNFLVHSDSFFLMMRGEISFFYGISASRYWNRVKTVGLWAWRNQNVTKTLGFYGGFKRNVWHRRWAKGGLKMVFVSRPGHAVSPFWGFFSFKVPEVFHVHNFHKPAKTSIIASKPYNFFSAFKWFFWWWAEKSAFPWYLRGKGIMSKLSVYGREETKTWPKP